MASPDFPLSRPSLAPSIIVVLLAVAAALLQGCTASTVGPTIGFCNETDTVMKAVFWVGDRDPSRPGGARMRRAEEMNVAPSTRTRDSLNTIWQYRSAADTVVRVQVRPATPSFAGVNEYWFEFVPPSPFMVRATRTPSGEFEFSREGRGDLVPVPPEFWVRPN